MTSSGWRRHHRRADDVIGLESEEMTVVRSSERLGGDEFKGQNDALFKGRKQKKKKKKSFEPFGSSKIGRVNRFIGLTVDSGGSRAVQRLADSNMRTKPEW